MEKSKGSILANCCFWSFIAFFLFIQSTKQHYIGDLDACTLSIICNHTWTIICGYNEANSHYRLFLDECDMHEYNCENNKSYIEADFKTCSEKCTKGDQSVIATTPMPSTTPPSTEPITTTVESTTIKTTTKKAEVSITTTEDVTETTTDKTDTPTLTVETTTTLETTTEKTSQSPESTTKANETTTEVTTDELVTENNTTIPQETTKFSTSPTTTPKPNSTCYPNHCFVPSTWETTAEGESRDFVQILRERFGDRVKILRHTSHFPKEAVYVRRSESFISGRHMERRR